MHIQWVSSAVSSLLEPVRTGLSAHISFAHSHALEHALMPRDAWSSDVLVLEPCSDAPPALAWDRFDNASRHRAAPLTLVLLPHSAADQAVAWLNAGADRCMPRESDVRLVQAMIRSMLHRRHGQLASLTEHGPLRFEHDTHTLFHESQRVPLTHRETVVASVLFQPAGRYIRHEEILKALCAQGPHECRPALVSLYVHRINKKIQPYGLHIGFKRGYGYRLQVPPPQDKGLSALAWLRTVPTRGGGSPPSRQGHGAHHHA